jgi:hypothetical protein
VARHVDAHDRRLGEPLELGRVGQALGGEDVAEARVPGHGVADHLGQRLRDVELQHDAVRRDRQHVDRGQQPGREIDERGPRAGQQVARDQGEALQPLGHRGRAVARHVDACSSRRALVEGSPACGGPATNTSYPRTRRRASTMG